jgi:hypothetical protein
MKKSLLYISVVSAFLFVGCYADKESGKESTMSGSSGVKTMKCGAGKCGGGKCGGGK